LDEMNPIEVSLGRENWMKGFHEELSHEKIG
jgi:hypothetical protein